MPAIIVKAPQGVFDGPARAAMAQDLTAAAKVAEQGGDDPSHAVISWVLINEVGPGHIFAGGADPSARVIPVVVLFHYPAGAIVETLRPEAVRLIHEAVAAAKPAGDPRPVLTSVILTEIPDGTWGASGHLWRMPDFVRAAGFKHLQHLIAEPA